MNSEIALPSIFIDTVSVYSLYTWYKNREPIYVISISSAYWINLANSSIIVNYIFPIAPGSLASFDFAFIPIEIVLSQFWLAGQLNFYLVL